jgi:hypothetical protein
MGLALALMLMPAVIAGTQRTSGPATTQASKPKAKTLDQVMDDLKLDDEQRVALRDLVREAKAARVTWWTQNGEQITALYNRLVATGQVKDRKSAEQDLKKYKALLALAPLVKDAQARFAATFPAEKGKVITADADLHGAITLELHSVKYDPPPAVSATAGCAPCHMRHSKPDYPAKK